MTLQGYGVTKKHRGVCVFCARRGDLDREDAMPKWVNRFLQPRLPPNVSIYQRSGQHQGGAVIKVRQTPTKTFSNVKVPVVCKTCNGGWMSLLEKTAARFLKPMMVGADTTLSV